MPLILRDTKFYIVRLSFLPMHLISFHLVSIITFSCNSRTNQGNLVRLYACSVISQITVPFFASSCTQSLFAVSLKALHAELISEWYYKNHSLLKQVGTNLCYFSAQSLALRCSCTLKRERPNKVTSSTGKKMSSDKGRGIWTFRRLNPASVWLTGEINMHNLLCPFSWNVPASMCRRPIGYRSCAGGIHEADLHRLPKTGGNQIKDTCGLVLHADQRKRRSSKSDSCRLQLCYPIWNGASRQFVNCRLDDNSRTWQSSLIVSFFLLLDLQVWGRPPVRLGRPFQRPPLLERQPRFARHLHPNS